MSQQTHFQMPGVSGAPLLQALTDTSVDAVGGRGIFAWATSYGVAALFGNPDFEKLLHTHPFEMVIGTDSITDEKAIVALKAAAARFPKLDVKVVLNESRSLFHPKLIWLTTEFGAALFVGSGNLTRGGLLGNWEAFAEIELTSQQAQEIRASTDFWLSTLTPGLVELHDPRVMVRVAQNSGDERSLRRPTPNTPEKPLEAPDYSDWLVAELNKSRKNALGQSMFSQASFDGATFASFFGYAGAEVDVVLTEVKPNGSLGGIESRKGRYKAASINYYFELGSVQGLPYPANGRPIAVFGRLLGGGYVYRVVLPGSAGHSQMSALLTAQVGNTTGTRMRRAIVSTDQITDAWPEGKLATSVAPAS